MVPAGPLLMFSRDDDAGVSNPATESARSSKHRAIANDNVGLLELARTDRCVKKMETIMRRVLIAMQVALLGCAPAFAQAGGVGIPTPGIAATSPLGMTAGPSVAPTGIPLGATELASPGISPATNGALGMSGNGTTCSAIGNSSSGISGLSTFDGGGTATGMGTSLPGNAVTSATCGTGSGSVATSSPGVSSLSPVGTARSGIPLGSVEINNAGISPPVVVPAPTIPLPAPPSSAMGAPGSFLPSSSAFGTTSLPSSIPGTGIPCGTIGSAC
jgi:hypothetical protein